jgi:predicted nucleic acid-binding Zn ribbon protein
VAEPRQPRRAPRPAEPKAEPTKPRTEPGKPAPADASTPTAPTEGANAAGQGPALARAAIEAALAKRRVTARPRRADAESGDAKDGQPRRRRGYTGPGPDPRDPQPLANVLARLVKARGWARPAAEATVFGEWARVVGAEVAAHSRPVKLEEGVLTVEAESTAWATQLRLLAGRLLARIAGEVGNGVVRSLNIHGPTAPSWQRGPRRVRGRGPRDTYG